MLAKKFFGILFLLVTLIFSQPVHAEKTDWFAQNYDFRGIRSVILLDVTVNPELDYGGMIGLRGLQNTFRNRCRQVLYPQIQFFSEDEAMIFIGTQLNMNLEKLSLENPTEARLIVMNNAWRMADAFILGSIESWGDRSYTPSSNISYAKIVENRTYYDERGHARPDTVIVPLPAQYLPEGTDVPAIGMILRAYSTKNESIIFERYEMRIRRSDESQTELFSSMCESFSKDFLSKIR